MATKFHPFLLHTETYEAMRGLLWCFDYNPYKWRKGGNLKVIYIVVCKVATQSIHSFFAIDTQQTIQKFIGLQKHNLCLGQVTLFFLLLSMQHIFCHFLSI